MTRLLRKIARVLAALGVLVLLLFAVVSGLIWLTIPGVRQDATLPGLSAPVDSAFDTDWVPRIHAQSDTDAATALGFVHARDRMFQMDLMRRAASGRRSELIGPATLPLGRMCRPLGGRRPAGGVGPACLTGPGAWRPGARAPPPGGGPSPQRGCSGA
jgi:penicillin amidase